MGVRDSEKREAELPNNKQKQIMRYIKTIKRYKVLSHIHYCKIVKISRFCLFFNIKDIMKNEQEPHDVFII